jgi:hypothetical protein
LDWYETVFELIDMRSFSNLWFWIALAVLWSTTSHFVLGVPYDLVQRSARQGGQAEADLLDLARVNVNRLIYIQEAAGVWVLAFTCAILTTLAMLGFWYGAELAQAVFLLMFPMSIVGALSISRAHKIRALDPDATGLRSELGKHRFWSQVIGMISIFVTSVWGMYQNMIGFGGLGA